MLQLGEYVKVSYCALRGLNIDLFHRRPHIKPWGLPKFLPLNFGKRSPFPYPGEGTLLIGTVYYNDIESSPSHIFSLCNF